jgi:orotate phosphoribosyltransferase
MERPVPHKDVLDAVYIPGPIANIDGQALLLVGVSNEVLPYYMDFKILQDNPPLRSEVLNSFEEMLQDEKETLKVVAGVQTGGASFAGMLADRLGLPYSWARSSMKNHGIPKMIDGGGVKGKRVVLVDDVTTSGGSMVADIQKHRKAGGIVDIALVGVAKTQKSIDALEQENVTVMHYVGPEEMDTYARSRQPEAFEVIPTHPTLEMQPNEMYTLFSNTAIQT